MIYICCVGSASLDVVCDEPIACAFVLEVKNQFQKLSTDELDHPPVEERWNQIKATYCTAAESALGYLKSTDKTWLTRETWKRIEERKTIKSKILNTKSKRMQERLQKEYSSKDKEIKRSARQDKRAYVDKLAEKAETAAQKSELSTVYRITKQLCRHTKVAASIVKDKDGNALTTEQMQAKRWAEHFTEVLNTEAPTITADPPAPNDDLDIATGVPTLQEVTHAIKQMKTGKSPGIDNICIELLKTDVITAGNIFTGLFSDIWTANEIPRDWNKGLIVKIPKKGDLQNCDNWRGITLLSMPSKIFCRVLLNRIEEAIDVNLRQEQAGFRRGKGCMDQIFSLRNIIEQSTEWNAPLCIGFIDFKKAFDSIHHETLWKILRHYGLPQKIVGLFSVLYKSFECSVLMDSTQTYYFPVKSGVRQGCILSPILFNITLDYIMRQTTRNVRHGIQWTMFSQLEDLDYADDIALLSTNARHLQQKANVLNENAKKAGLHINMEKTKVMHLNLTEPHPQIMIDGEELEAVDDFTYLGSNISAENSVQKDISARINKARNSYCSLRNIWKSNIYSLKTKLRLFNRNVISVLLYGCQSWRVSKDDMNKLDVFQTKFLRRTCNIFWPNKISNEDLYRRTNSPISTQIQKHRLRWLGHVLRMPQDSIPKVALRWTPTGKRNRGRPKTIWRRTITTELSDIGLTMGEAQVIAQDRHRWRRDIVALCPTLG